MAGFISRWDNEHVRETTDGLLRLDIRQLARQGGLSTSPGSNTSITLTWPGSPPDWIVVRHDGNDPDVMTLAYRTRSLGGAWEEVCERMPLTRTACNFGGSRPWVRCLGCGKRQAVLFCRGGLFRCRICHDLAYQSTRESAPDRVRRRALG